MKYTNAKPNVIAKSSEEFITEEYEHAQNVYKAFNCKNLAMYTGLYCLYSSRYLASIYERDN